MVIKKYLFPILAGLLILSIPIFSVISASLATSTYLPLVQKAVLPTATNTPTPTPVPRITGNIVITTINYHGTGPNEPDEYVEIRNDDSWPIQLKNWTLSDLQNHIFLFPSYVINPTQVCRIYTNEIHPEWCGFSYGSSSSIWNNTHDCADLRDSSVALIDRYCY